MNHNTDSNMLGKLVFNVPSAFEFPHNSLIALILETGLGCGFLRESYVSVKYMRYFVETIFERTKN